LNGKIVSLSLYLELEEEPTPQQFYGHGLYKMVLVLRNSKKFRECKAQWEELFFKNQTTPCYSRGLVGNAIAGDPNLTLG
jgi:hypothetical protein